MNKFLVLVRGDFSLRRGIELVLSLDPDVEFCLADPRALQQILLNLFSNAADACEGREAPKIEIMISRSRGMVHFRIADNGRGMSEEQQNDLFKPFYTTKNHGTGLGLVIVKKMLSSMNSEIEVFSRKDEGTKVDIFIPEGGTGADRQQEKTLVDPKNCG
jgi:signal transduction histidine kinase